MTADKVPGRCEAVFHAGQAADGKLYRCLLPVRQPDAGDMISPADARVAQLVEQRIENPRVGGSNPPPGTISKASRSVGRGSSDCFQMINVLEQELVFPWCG